MAGKSAEQEGFRCSTQRSVEACIRSGSEAREEVWGSDPRCDFTRISILSLGENGQPTIGHAAQALGWNRLNNFDLLLFIIVCLNRLSRPSPHSW